MRADVAGVVFLMLFCLSRACRRIDLFDPQQIDLVLSASDWIGSDRL